MSWSGRVDPAGMADTRRWHQVIAPAVSHAPPGLALLGFASDVGVRRNQGRIGAALGPAALRRAMSNLPVWDGQPNLYDAGDVFCIDENLEAAQTAYAMRVATLLESGHAVIGLGGGHEIAYASYRGLADHLRHSSASIGIINLDAHLDIRDQAEASSGTPFLQAIRHAHASHQSLRYFCLGASRQANTAGMFALAEQLSINVLMEDEIDAQRLPACIEQLNAWMDQVDAVYLTICLDVLPQWTAPAVSAPNAGGLPLQIVEPLVDAVLAAGKTRVIDIAELSPPHDQDGATARVAARLVHKMSRRLQLQPADGPAWGIAER